MQTGGVGATLKAYPVKGETGMFTRSSGVLLHITSLPGPYGCGTFGGGARSFIDFLAESGFSWWQVLPFSPPDLGNSPYTAYSAFAGNPIMIDPALLHQQGLITGEELEAVSYTHLDVYKRQSRPRSLRTLKWVVGWPASKR